MKSADPLAPPAIKFNFLNTDYDLRALTAGMKMVRTFVEQPSLKKYIAEEVLPGAWVKSDADYEKAIRENGISNLHPVGTCRMGPEGSDCVVDPRLRVVGVDGLRVIDASVMPTVPAGNTNAPTIMVAEKGAAMILEDVRA